MNIISVQGNEKLIAQPSLAVENNTSATQLSKQFGSYLNEAINNIGEQQQQVSELRNKFMSGEMTDPHQLMIAAEQVSLSLELVVQVRNKAIEAYQEIMRTQI